MNRCVLLIQWFVFQMLANRALPEFAWVKTLNDVLKNGYELFKAVRHNFTHNYALLFRG